MIRHITKAIVLLIIAAGLAGCAKSETVKPDEQPAETETVATEVAGEKSAEEKSRFPFTAYIERKSADIYAFDGNFQGWDMSADKLSAGMEYKPVGSFSMGDVVEVLDENGEWVKVKKDGVEGWANKQYLGDEIPYPSVMVVSNEGAQFSLHLKKRMDIEEYIQYLIEECGVVMICPQKVD
jgi:hypothetical protein